MTEKEFKKWVNLQSKEFHSRNVSRYQTKNKITVVDFKHQKMACARCHPDDVFNVTIGTAIAYARLKGEEIPTIDKEPERWRAELQGKYYSVSYNAEINETHDIKSAVDDKCYNSGNYFKTFKRAEEVAEKIKLLFKLEQYHDMYCPDYVPDWSNRNQNKYAIFYDNYFKKICYTNWQTSKYNTVYFPTSEIARKVCEKLNEEMRVKND